jgi:hypothetical protein
MGIAVVDEAEAKKKEEAGECAGLVNGCKIAFTTPFETNPPPLPSPRPPVFSPPHYFSDAFSVWLVDAATGELCPPFEGLTCTFTDPVVEESFIKYSWNTSQRSLKRGAVLMNVFFTLYLSVLQSVHDIILFIVFQNLPCLALLFLAFTHNKLDPIEVVNKRRLIATVCCCGLCLVMSTFSTVTSELAAVLLTCIVLIATSIIVKNSYQQKVSPYSSFLFFLFFLLTNPFFFSASRSLSLASTA